MKFSIGKKHVAVLSTAALALGLAVAVSSPASAATVYCSWTIYAATGDVTASNNGGNGSYGMCAAVQAKARHYNGGSYYTTITGPVSGSSSTVPQNGANAVDQKQGRAEPINLWSPWSTQTSNVYMTAFQTYP